MKKGRKKIVDLSKKRVVLSITLPNWLIDKIPKNRSKYIEGLLLNEISRANK